jgi:predicted kinase
MSEQTYLLSFEGVSEAEANRYAEELREVLLDATNDLDVQRQRENPLAQDLGASLALIMGTPAFVAAIQAIGNWLQKRRSASLTIVTAEKKIVAENLTNKDAAQLLQLFLTQTTSRKEPGA